MKKIFLILIVMAGIAGCASNPGPQRFWANPSILGIPDDAYNKQYYQALNFCQGVASGAHPQDTLAMQHMATRQGDPSNVPQAMHNFAAAHAQLVQARQFVQMRNNCMQAHGWILATREEINAISHNQAFSRFEQRANQGDAEAQYITGLAYLTGHGVPKDDCKAVEW